MIRSFCAIPLQTLVYASPASREEFERLPLPEQVHGWVANKTETILRNDGQQWEHRVTSKTLGELCGGQVAVIFQWFDYRPAPVVAETAEATAAA